MEQVDLRKDGRLEENLVDLAAPFRWRHRPEFAIDPHACGTNLGAIPQARNSPGRGAGAGPLPVAQEHPVGDVGRDEVPDGPEAIEGTVQTRRVAGRRIEEKITRRELHHRHSHRQRQATCLDRLAIHDPDRLGDRLEDVERRIGDVITHVWLPRVAFELFNAELQSTILGLPGFYRRKAAARTRSSFRPRPFASQRSPTRVDEAA